MRLRRRWYRIYGLLVQSAIRLPYPEATAGADSSADLTLESAPARAFSRARAASPDGEKWFQHRPLCGGDTYLRWRGLFEFIISGDGNRILYRSEPGAHPDSFHTYLLNQVVSFALVRSGIEPVHATAVLTSAGAVAFLGDSGYGKSSLAASFLNAGFQLVTDDLLVLRRVRTGYVVEAGPPRIKLFPEIAGDLLPGWGGAGVAMNPLTNKKVIHLERGATPANPVPLAAIYVLTPPRLRRGKVRVVLRKLQSRTAFLELARNTFNAQVVEPARLRRHFEFVADVVARVSVKTLSYPLRLEVLNKVRAAVLRDVGVVANGNLQPELSARAGEARRTPAGRNRR
jgi:hypothetical protein